MELLNDDRFAALFEPRRRLTIVDGGARGLTDSPLNRLGPDRRHVLRFEPDADADILGIDIQTTVMREALWSHSTRVKLHMTAQPACSSIHPPDARLTNGFTDPIGKPARTVLDTADVPAVALDQAVESADLPGVDLIKLDIHGSEFEALIGSRRLLKTTVSAVWVEAWPVQVHDGQHSLGELHQLMEELGFLMLDANVAEWPRKPVSSGPRYLSRGQSTQMELLYILDALGQKAATVSRDRLLAAIGLADLFGHSAYAEQLAHAGGSEGVLTAADTATITECIRANRRISKARIQMSRVAKRLQRMLDRFVVSLAE